MHHAIRSTQIASIIIALFGTGIAPVFVGKPGIGKSDGVAEAVRVLSNKLSSERGAPVSLGYHIEHLASYSEVDVRGYMLPVPSAVPGGAPTAQFTKPAFWSAIEANPDGGVLFFDEFMQASPEVQKVISTLLLDGRIGDYTLPKGWMVVLAGNGTEDGAGAIELLSHLINRVCMIEVNPPSVEEWCDWAVAAGVPSELVAFASLRWGIVVSGEIPAAPNTPYITCRSLARLGFAANNFPGGIRAMSSNPLGQAIMAGMVGEGAMVEISSLVQVAMTLPSFADVVKSPTTTPVPTNVSHLYTMAYMVASNVDTSTAEPAITYLSRMQPDMAVVAITAMNRRDPNMIRCPAMAKWVLANRALVEKFNKYILTAMGM